MTLIEAIASIDMDDTIDRMNAYAFSRLRSVQIKDFDGKAPIDFVGDLLLKIMEGERDWTKAKCSFKEFLFGCLKSEISNFFKTRESVVDDDLPIGLAQKSQNVDEQKAQATALLSKEGANGEEIEVFECWMDGITKPAEVANELGVDVGDVYTITKRLERRLEKIQTQAKSIYE